MKKLFLILVIIVVANLVLAGLVVYPLARQIVKGSEDLVSAKQSLASAIEQSKTLIELKKDSQAITSDMYAIDSLFIDSKAPINFIEFLEDLAEDSGLAIDIEPPLPPLAKTPKKEIWPSMTFRLGLDGAFTDYLKFVEKIQASPYLIEIQSLSIKKARKQGMQTPEDFSSNNVEANLSFKVFVKK